MPERVLRWWPIILFFVGWLASGIGAYFSVIAALKLADQRASVIERTIAAHDERNRIERAELLVEIHALREEMQDLMAQQRVLLRDLK